MHQEGGDEKPQLAPDELPSLQPALPTGASAPLAAAADYPCSPAAAASSSSGACASTAAPLDKGMGMGVSGPAVGQPWYGAGGAPPPGGGITPGSVLVAIPGETGEEAAGAVVGGGMVPSPYKVVPKAPGSPEPDSRTVPAPSQYVVVVCISAIVVAALVTVIVVFSS